MSARVEGLSDREKIKSEVPESSTRPSLKVQTELHFCWTMARSCEMKTIVMSRPATVSYLDDLGLSRHVKCRRRLVCDDDVGSC
jgi:hypothetical protein